MAGNYVEGFGSWYPAATEPRQLPVILVRLVPRKLGKQKTCFDLVKVHSFFFPLSSHLMSRFKSVSLAELAVCWQGAEGPWEGSWVERWHRLGSRG